MAKYKEATVNIKDLVLDKSNPRFAELYTGLHDEESLIKYLLLNEAAIDVAKGISNEGGFYADRPLWVIKEGTKYLVKDGNRRCAAAKALKTPGKFELDLPVMALAKLPVLIYDLEKDVDERIFQEHANSLFRSWERIAKALEVYRLFKTGTQINSMRDIDSSPGQLIKLASFYYEAVKIGGDDLRDLLARKVGKSGGRTIIFERLFAPKICTLCGYAFKSSPYFDVQITDIHIFNLYITAIVNLLIDDTKYEIKTETVDNEKERFLDRLKPYGFDYKALNSTTSGGSSGNSGSGTTGSSGTTSDGTSSGGTTATGSGKSGTKGSTKKKPVTERKKLPPGIKSRINEFFDLDADDYSNAKMAMARVTFECVLKYTIENTKFNGRTAMSKSGYFGAVYRNKYADATLMKTQFTNLIKSTGDQNAFKVFDLENLHQIIHNYKTGALVKDAKQTSHNLLHLIEFMLQDENDLLDSLDLTKL